MKEGGEWREDRRETIGSNWTEFLVIPGNFGRLETSRRLGCRFEASRWRDSRGCKLLASARSHGAINRLGGEDATIAVSTREGTKSRARIKDRSGLGDDPRSHPRSTRINRRYYPA